MPQHKAVSAALLDNARAWLSAVEVATVSGVAAPETTRILTRMERRGWVESAPTPERRCWQASRIYRLTDNGVRAARALIDRAPEAAA